MFSRPIVIVNGMSRAAQAGDGKNIIPQVVAISADANDTISASKIASGVISYTGFTAGRTLTTESGANLDTAFPEMGVGDSIAVEIGISTAFAGTLSAGTGITLAGKTAVPASGKATLYFTKTAAATYTCTAI